MKIHQIFITDDNVIPKELPLYMKICVEQIQKVYPESEYKLYSGEEIEEIIKNNFSNEVYWSYKKLRPYACKCDLARACLLYLYGGLYVSTLDKWEFFAFRDRPYSSWRFWSVMNSIMYAKNPKCGVVEKIINRIVKHCKLNYYGQCPIDVTATTVLGRSIMEESDEIDNDKIATLGQLYDITPEQKKEFLERYKNIFHKNKDFCNINSAFFMDASPISEYKVVAFYKPGPGGNLDSLGYKKVNNYIKMWHNRQIYDESMSTLGKYV
jgi:hypothetical protein